MLQQRRLRRERTKATTRSSNLSVCCSDTHASRCLTLLLLLLLLLLLVVLVVVRASAGRKQRDIRGSKVESHPTSGNVICGPRVAPPGRSQSR